MSGTIPPLYCAGMFLRTGHPVYRQGWLDFVADPRDDVREVAEHAGISVPAVVRAMIRTLNGVDPVLVQNPFDPSPVRSPKHVR